MMAAVAAYVILDNRGRDYHIAPNYVGKSTKFSFKLLGDKLYLQGTMPNNIKIEEVYKRLE